MKMKLRLLFGRLKIRLFRCSVQTEPPSPYENLNAKIEVKFLTGTVENLNGKL